MVEPQWNPMVEAQALDRVHRIGQHRDVTITRYIVKSSIELVRSYSPICGYPFCRILVLLFEYSCS